MYINNLKDLALYFDHTLLKPETLPSEIINLCYDAKLFHFASVCVNSVHLEIVVNQLSDTQVKPITVVGFPLGATMSEVKAFETEIAIKKGAKEIDMVMDLGSFKEKNYLRVKSDIEEVVKAAANIPVKVIIETGILSDSEKKDASKIAADAGAKFVKTCTGFFSGKATIKDIHIIREAVGDSIGIKASGGIRTLNKALAMIKAGANRIGSSSSVNIINEMMGRISK